jgi:sulfate adenylyltransferase subunit 2
MLVGQNVEALAGRQTFPSGAVDRLTCCRVPKTDALARMLAGGDGGRQVLDLASDRYVPDPDRAPNTGVIAGVRADEERSRSKERYFSPRSRANEWDIGAQPPEFWNQFATEVAEGVHVRIHPLLDWTELNVWEHIEREGIPTVSLYHDQGDGTRYHSLGCGPCTRPVPSTARTVAEVVEELRTGPYAGVAERAGRAQDADDGGGLETLRRGGYM